MVNQRHLDPQGPLWPLPIGLALAAPEEAFCAKTNGYLKMPHLAGPMHAQQRRIAGQFFQQEQGLKEKAGRTIKGTRAVRSAAHCQQIVSA
jgi:hypothetical protein